MDLKVLKLRDLSMQEDIPGIRRRRTQEWFDGVQNTGQDEGHIISRLYHCISVFCNDALSNLVDSTAQKTEPMSKPLYRLLDSAYDSFVEWGDEFKVGGGSLDEALKDSQDLRQFTIGIMIRICETLTNDLLPAMIQVMEATRPGQGRDQLGKSLQSKAEEIKSVRDDAIHVLHAQSNSGSDSDDGSSLEDALEGLKGDVEALVDLGQCFEDPIRDTLITEKAAAPALITADDGKSTYQTFLDGIKQKYPRCHDGLALSLSKALYATTMRLLSERQAISHGVVERLKPISAIPKDSGYGTSIRDPPSHDSGSLHGDSMPVGSSYARTLASYGEIDDGAAGTPFPSQPKGLRIGEKFPCIACGRQVAKAETGTAWRRHLLSDLQPWICCQVSCDCARTPYSTRNEWLKHLQAQHEVHPHWNDKKCPFCLHIVPAGGREMIRHVERHLRQLSLAALPANTNVDSDGSESEIETDVMLPPTAGDRGHRSRQKSADVESLEDHPLYTHAAQGDDGLWHCPWEGEGYCDHKPTVLKADFDKFVRFHLDSLRCKVEGCDEAGRAFATQEILYLHEQKEHDMHKGGGRFLCTSSGCGRSRPGNGFANKWVQLEHIKNVHENIPDLPRPSDDD